MVKNISEFVAILLPWDFVKNDMACEAYVPY